MFQFRRFPAYAYFVQRTLAEYCSAGFPHSEILGLTLMCSSPRLIAACHVLRRLLMPRHSPCALISLTFVGAKSAPSVSGCAENFIRSLAPPLPRETTSLGFVRESSGSLRIMQASEFIWLNCFYPLFHNFCFLPSVACFALLSIYIVQFSRYRPSALFQGQIETPNPSDASIHS